MGRVFSPPSIQEEVTLPDLHGQIAISFETGSKKAYLKDMGKNYLKVIIVEEEGSLVILTAYWFAKTRLKRYNPN